MPAVGTIIIVAGLWLLVSAVRNRQPVNTILDIIRNPAAARETLDKTAGSGYNPVYEDAANNIGNSGLGIGGGTSGTITGGTTGKAQAAIAFARAQIGKPYKWGATGPNAYDCSGLVQSAYKAAGVTLPRTTALMIFVGKPVTRDALQPGDLVFPNASHVAIYTGDGKFVEAPTAGTNVREVPMWGFWQARRVT